MDRCVRWEQSIKKSSVIRLLLVSDVQPRHARRTFIHQFIKQSRVYLVQINSFLNRSVQIICWELRCVFKSQSISQIFCKYPAAVTSEPPSEASDARVAAGMRQSVIFEARTQNVFANVLFTPPADAFLAAQLQMLLCVYQLVANSVCATLGVGPVVFRGVVFVRMWTVRTKRALRC